MGDDQGVIRRTATLGALAASVLLVLTVLAVPARAQEPTTSTTHGLPRTDLEAEQLDDGTTSGAEWYVGSGIAAVAAVGLGGWFLKRRADAEG